MTYDSVQKFNSVENYILQMRPILRKRALFSDGTADYRMPPEPKAGDTVKIRFRTAADNVDLVVLCHEDEHIEMYLTDCDRDFDYYEAEIRVGEEQYKYHFEIISGMLRCTYDRAGVSRDFRPQYEFCIIPGFSTPKWAKGAVMYQIFTDRFCNGDTSNDVKTGEYYYINRQTKQVENWDKCPEDFDVANFYGGDLAGVLSKMDYLEELGVDVEFPENGYHGYDIVETAKRIVKIYGDKFLHMDEQERLHEFRTIALKEKLAALKEDLEAFNVTFDVWFSEQTLHDADKIKEACELLTERGYMYEKDGALWLKATAYGDDKDRVVIRDNGVPTYLAADIAYHWNKFSRGFDRVINLWGADHHGYIARMKAAVGALGYDPEQLEVLILQMVSLYRNGELVKMSKRTGQSVTLNELIEEVGTDAARFFFAMRSIDSQLDFDLTLATEKSNENPVYYIQYAHARICSIMRQLAEENVVEAAAADYNLLTDATELELIKKLGEYQEMLELAAKERAVHRVAHYVHDLAGLFHSFYNQCRILGVDPEVQQARIKLVQATRHTIKHALNILGVSAPERM